MLDYTIEIFIQKKDLSPHKISIPLLKKIDRKSLEDIMSQAVTKLLDIAKY